MATTADDLFGSTPPWTDEDAPPVDPWDLPAQAAPPQANKLAQTVAATAVLDTQEGSIELSIPGDTFNHKFGAERITVPLKDAHKLPAIVAATMGYAQAAFDIAQAYENEHKPAARPSGVAAGGYAAQVPTQAPVQAAPSNAFVPQAQGLGAAAVQGLAAGTHTPGGMEAGLVSVQKTGKNGAYDIVFPSVEAFSKQDLIALGTEMAVAELGLPSEHVMVFDNRADMSKSFAPAVVKLHNSAPDGVKACLVGGTNQKGEPWTYSIGTVVWNKRTNEWEFKASKEYLAAVMKISQAYRAAGI